LAGLTDKPAGERVSIGHQWSILQGIEGIVLVGGIPLLNEKN
jgi:hypothetical protein